MTNLEFVKMLELACDNKSLYVKGGFGAPAGYGDNRQKYIDLYSYNTKRAAKINAASDDTFFFDCVCLGKGILWGWYGATGKRYGGAKYASNGVPDFTATSVPKHCTTWSDNMGDELTVGEWLVERDANGTIDHVGYYVGNGYVIEASPRGSDGVQYNPLSARAWCGHGRIKYLDYVEERKSRYIIVLTDSYDTESAAQFDLTQIARNGKVVKIK